VAFPPQLALWAVAVSADANTEKAETVIALGGIEGHFDQLTFV